VTLLAGQTAIGLGLANGHATPGKPARRACKDLSTERNRTTARYGTQRARASAADAGSSHPGG
jgi:hypothetical protein